MRLVLIIFFSFSNWTLLVTGLEVTVATEVDPMVEVREDTEEDREAMEVVVRGDMDRVVDMVATKLSDDEEIL